MKKTTILFLAFFINLMFTFFDPAPALSSFICEDIKINTGAAGYASFAPKIASDQSGRIYIVWKDDRPGTPGKNIYFNRSHNFGTTWLKQDMALGHTEKPNSIRIGCDSNGRVYVTWIRGSAGNQDAMIAVSSNYGQSWQTHQLDIGGAHWESNTILNIHFDYTESGNICVVWDGGGNNDEIYINCSDDHGQTWMPSYNQVNSDVPYPYDIHRDPKVAVDSSGRVYVIWLDNRGASGGERYIYVNRSFDLGQTWPQDIGFHGSPHGIVSLNPQIDCDEDGNVYVAWQQFFWPHYHLCLFRKSSDAGNTWSSEVKHFYHAKYPRIASDAEGRVFYAYLHVGQPDYQKILFSRSLDHGTTWQSNVQVNANHDVESDHFDLAVKDEKVYIAWENNNPWQGIYFNYSANHGATWQPQDIRVDHNIDEDTPTAKPSLSASRHFVFVTWEDGRDEATDIYFNRGVFNNFQRIHREAHYILSCQYLNPESRAYGAINNIYGAEPTWIVPRENALAILGLIEAAGGIDNAFHSLDLAKNDYLRRANKAMDYLIRVQDKGDGAWFDQYSYEQPFLFSKSPTQTAQVMMAMFALGFREDRYQAMYSAAQYLLLCQQNGFGGLLCGGKQEDGNFSPLHWASDNSFAYLALKAARGWGLKMQDPAFVAQCHVAAENILNGINQYLYHNPMWQPARWHQAVDQSGNPANPANYDWINYAPYMLNLPVSGIDPEGLSQWIHDTFQLEDGGCIGPITDRQYPGLSFQASLCWLDAGMNHFANKAIAWSETSGLWQTTPDPNGITGGWIDWVSVSNPQDTAPWWERFIDTSFYAIAAWQGGYDFTVFTGPAPVAPNAKSRHNSLENTRF